MFILQFGFYLKHMNYTQNHNVFLKFCFSNIGHCVYMPTIKTKKEALSFYKFLESMPEEYILYVFAEYSICSPNIVQIIFRRIWSSFFVIFSKMDIRPKNMLGFQYYIPWKQHRVPFFKAERKLSNQGSANISKQTADFSGWLLLNWRYCASFS